MAPPPVAVTLAVAPPHDKDRLRFMVEKLAELEVRRLAFLQARFGAGRLPDQSKATSWAIGALEQSQGGWLMEISPGWTEVGGLDPANLVVCGPGAAGHQEATGSCDPRDRARRGMGRRRRFQTGRPDLGWGARF